MSETALSSITEKSGWKIQRTYKLSTGYIKEWEENTLARDMYNSKIKAGESKCWHQKDLK